MVGELVYQERLSSNKTEALFLGLTGLSGLLLVWRLVAFRFDFLAAVFLFFFVFFLFYSLNYRTLTVHLSPQELKLAFGIFTWKVSLDNIEDCCIDDLPVVMRLGGAGIHFMLVHERYRASFNFLEYPRVLIVFKRKKGPVQAISFSTRHPENLLHLIRETISASERQSIATDNSQATQGR